MTRYHLSLNGKPAICRAKPPRPCPLGGEHFTTLSSAQAAADITDFGKDIGLDRVATPSSVSADLKNNFFAAGQNLVPDKEEERSLKISNDGSIFTMKKMLSGKLKPHSFEDKPSLVRKDGSKEWHRFGRLNRQNGPAVVDSRGERWYHNDQLHRSHGDPAVENNDGSKEWWEDGARHRGAGPAVINADGSTEYWFNGVQYSKENFEQTILPRAIERLSSFTR